MTTAHQEALRVLRTPHQRRPTQAAASLAANGPVPAQDDLPPSAILATDPFPRECSYIVLLDTLSEPAEFGDLSGNALQHPFQPAIEPDRLLDVGQTAIEIATHRIGLAAPDEGG